MALQKSCKQIFRLCFNRLGLVYNSAKAMIGLLNCCVRISRLRPITNYKPLNRRFTVFSDRSPGIHDFIKSRPFTSRAYDVNTNVSKDVILFKYENPRFFKMLNIFALCQFGFWSYLSHFAFTTLKDAPVEQPAEDASWYRKINLGENKYRNGITICCFLVGYGILGAAWMFCLRSVRFLVLRKGGDKVSFVTYGPFGNNRIMDVPLKCISAQQAREAARVQLPIKIKNRAFYYVLDMRGEFLNTKLYDFTVGLNRKL